MRFHYNQMGKLIFSFFFFLCEITIISTNLFQQGNRTKCCKPNEILAKIKDEEKNSYKCVYDKTKTLNVESEVFSDYPKIDCVDVLENTKNSHRTVVTIQEGDIWKAMPLNVTYNLPKCCPLHYTYEVLEHKCVESTLNKSFKEFIEKQLTGNFVVIKAGLEDCRSLITDYEFTNLHEILTNINEHHSLKISNSTFLHGNYCFDQVYNSENYVTRVCQSDLTACRRKKNETSKIKCIRKCCPDGNIYKNRMCTDNLFQGFNFINNTRIIDPKEPFGTIVPTHDCKKFLSDDANDEYLIDEKGSVRFTLQDNPPLYYSPFKDSHCFENVKKSNSNEIVMMLFVCLKEEDLTDLDDEDNYNK